MKIVFATLILASLLACSSQPKIQSLVSEAPESQGLNVVKNSGFDQFFLRRDNAGSSYSAILFSALNLDHLEIDNTRLDFPDRDWRLTEKDKQRWREMFSKRAADVFGSNASVLTTAQNAGPGVLKAEFEFLKFTPSAAKDDARSRPNNDKILTRSVGKLDIRITLSDSISGEKLAHIEDSREVGDNSYPELERNDRINNDRKLRLEMTAWLSQLNTTLSKLW